MDRSRESRRTRLRPWVSVNFLHSRALESACLCLSFVASAPRNTDATRSLCVLSASSTFHYRPPCSGIPLDASTKPFLRFYITICTHTDGLQSTLRELISCKCLTSVSIPSYRAVVSNSVRFPAGIQRVENMYSDRYVAADIIPPCDPFARCMS